jgi:hypothetical protein
MYADLRSETPMVLARDTGLIGSYTSTTLITFDCVTVVTHITGYCLAVANSSVIINCGPIASVSGVWGGIFIAGFPPFPEPVDLPLPNLAIAPGDVIQVVFNAGGPTDQFGFTISGWVSP